MQSEDCMYVSSDEGEYAVQALRASKAVTRIRKRNEKAGETTSPRERGRRFLDELEQGRKMLESEVDALHKRCRELEGERDRAYQDRDDARRARDEALEAFFLEPPAGVHLAESVARGYFSMVAERTKAEEEREELRKERDAAIEEQLEAAQEQGELRDELERVNEDLQRDLEEAWAMVEKLQGEEEDE
ncbi:uncharacterized protein SCHCODRAFT_01104893 [Schizophyllum commune H4-8]|nr:uncharacterized protein SCHCODRAFT_01104893 [Schizophyllum commune H4-8]KAI5887596.1 hypothetical protein SCHCODRAFT_01104893 [Schizophyllum commune H4-8]